MGERSSERFLAFAFVLLVLARAGCAAPALAYLSLPRILAVAGPLFIAWLRVSIVVDQMPCFLGVPNCD